MCKGQKKHAFSDLFNLKEKSIKYMRQHISLLIGCIDKWFIDNRYTSKYVIMSNNSNYLAPSVLLQHDAVSFVEMLELIVSRSEPFLAAVC